MSKPINKSGKRKVVKVGRDGRKRAYWVGTGQKPGGLRNAGAPGEKQSFLQKHGKKIAAGLAGTAALGVGLAARHHFKSEAGQKHLHEIAKHVASFDAKHGQSGAAQLAKGAALGVHDAVKAHVDVARAAGRGVVSMANFARRVGGGMASSLRGHKKVTAAGIGHEISAGADAVRGQQHSHPSHHSTPTHTEPTVYRESHDTHSFEGNGRRVGGSQWGAR